MNGSAPRKALFVVLSAVVLAALATPAGAAPDTSGRIYAWGGNDHRQLGQEADANHGAVQVCAGGDCGSSDPFTTAQAVAAGEEHSLALLSGGAVWAWGHNGSGRLGLGTSEGDSPPRPVCAPEPGSRCAPLTGVRSIAAGDSHSAAVLADGSVASWGNNRWGKLGTGDQGDRNTPEVVCRTGADEPCRGGAVEVSAGYSHTLALLEDGTVLAWGRNREGQLGVTGDALWYDAPQRVSLPDRAKAVAAGDYHSLALLEDGRIVAWGRNREGQLGNGGTSDTPLGPQAVRLSPEAKAIAAGLSFSMALTEDGSVYTWGSNAYGQLGNDSTQDSDRPVRVCSASGCGGGALTGAIAIAAGDRHALASSDGDVVWAWGWNEQGQLGNGGQGGHLTSPSVVLLGGDALTGVTRLGAGRYHSLAVRSGP